MEIIKYKSCNNKVKLLIIPTYSITNSNINSTNYSIIMFISRLYLHYNIHQNKRHNINKIAKKKKFLKVK
jgi:hypothetical protein